MACSLTVGSSDIPLLRSPWQRPGTTADGKRTQPTLHRSLASPESSVGLRSCIGTSAFQVIGRWCRLPGRCSLLGQDARPGAIEWCLPTLWLCGSASSATPSTSGIGRYWSSSGSRSSEAEPSAVVRASAVALSVILAWLTYRFVEKPIRNHPRRRRMAAVLCPAILLLAALAGIDGVIPARSFSPDIAKLVGEMSDASGPWAEMRGQSSIPGSARTAIFIGDSHADQYKARIARLIANEPERTRSAIFFDKGSCLPIPHVKRVSDRVCEDEVNIKEARAALAANENIDTVVLAASWRGQLKFHDLRFDAEGVSELMNQPGVVEKAFLSLEAMIESFRRQGRRVFVVLDNPADTDDAKANPRSLIVRRFSGTFSLRPLSDSTLTKRDVLTSQEPTRTRLILAAHRTGATVIDPTEFLCGASTCPIVVEDGRPIYFDSNHLRRDFVRDHVRYFDDIMTLDGRDLVQ